MAPTTKITAVILAGAMTVIVVWAMKEYCHTEIPGYVASAGTTIFSAIAGYFAPKGDIQ